MDNSLQIMNQLNEAVNSIDMMNRKLKSVEDEIENKLTIINTYNNYITKQLNSLVTKGPIDNQDTIIFGYTQDKNKIVGGKYGIYGTTINPEFVKMPSNVFNYYSPDGAIYKNNGCVKFYTRNSENELTNEDYKLVYGNMLKEDPVCNQKKYDVFKVFDSNSITLVVETPTCFASLSSYQFNMIEINPYLPGSFDIEAIRIFTSDQYYKNDMTIPDVNLTDTYADVGDMRILLDKTYNLYRIEFDIKLKYQQNGFPFGLRSLQFLKVDVDRENDVAILEIDRDSYIASIGKEIIVITLNGSINTNMDKYGVKCYMFYNNGVLQTEIDGPISRNITKFYASVPIRESLIGIKFNEIELR